KSRHWKTPLHCRRNGESSHEAHQGKAWRERPDPCGGPGWASRDYPSGFRRWGRGAGRKDSCHGRITVCRLNRESTMSCRIDRVVSADDLVVLLISGPITGQDVDLLRGVLERESSGFAIDLKNVSLVDREAVKLLARSEANGTELRNCPPYIREWV